MKIILKIKTVLTAMAMFLGIAVIYAQEVEKYNQEFLTRISFDTSNIDISLDNENFSDFPLPKNQTVKEGLSQVSLQLAYGFKL